MHGAKKRKIMKRENIMAMRENCNKTRKKSPSISEDSLLDLITQSEGI